MTEKRCAIAIDGPSGAGKSTIAKAVAARRGYIYVDTGAIYRTVGLAARRGSVDPHDAAGVAALLPGLDIRFDYGPDGSQRMYLNGEDVSAAIRTPEASMYASAVSAIPAVRAFLLDMQRDAAKTHSVVMDGRDIGTVVLPQAGLKIFLTASLEARAKRRLAELTAKGDPSTLADVITDMTRRDEQDTSRAAAPLKAAADAVVVDTSDMTLPQSIQAVCDLAEERFGRTEP